MSSAAAPGLPLASLVDACGRRGLATLELVCGHGHGLCDAVDADGDRAMLRDAEARGVHIAALAHEGPDASDAGAAVRLAARIGVPAVLPVRDLPPAQLCELVKAAADADGRVLLLHGTRPAAVRRLRRAVEAAPDGVAALAWEVDPATAAPADVPAVLRDAGPWLRYIRLRGGGPEAAAQTGMGVGTLMARLALARYAGPLVLAPSTPAYRTAWRLWLTRAGGWGCGSRQSDPSLVNLTPTSDPSTRSPA